METEVCDVCGSFIDSIAWCNDGDCPYYVEQDKETKSLDNEEDN